MNILIPHSWLLDHLDTKAAPKQIQQYLSLCGPSVERIYDIEGDSIYDIEVTSNRVDSMSVRGVAREAVVILTQFGIEAKLKPLLLPTENTLKPVKNLPLPKVTDKHNLSKRKIGIILSNIKRTPTPAWMAKRLCKIEVNIHESAIDITNYITHDLGHPCHAFDYDKLMQTGGEIIVTEAEAGKKMTTLDGETYTTLGGEIIFENAKGEIIDLPAIKGMANTSIDNSTKNIFLWIENLPAKKVRYASMGHAIRTMAAQLSEKHVDPHLAKSVLLKAVELYQQLCQAQIASSLYDAFTQKRENKIINLSSKKIEEYLGIPLQLTKVKQILSDLGCKVETNQNDKNYSLNITRPNFRPDLNIPVDLIEEIARIYGYHNLPSVVMPSRIPLNKPGETNFRLEEKIKNLLTNIGWQEVYTYSMISQGLAKQSNYKLSEHLKLQNPLTEDRLYLRRSLIPSLNEVLKNNPLEKNLSIFELANVYHPNKNDLPNEELKLTLMSKKSYREVKGILEIIFQSLYLNEVQIEYKQNGQQAKIYYQKKQNLGTITYHNEQTAIQLNWQILAAVAKKHPQYQPLPKTAFIIEDLTFSFNDKTALGAMIQDIKRLNNKIYKTELKDIYQNRYTFTIHYHDANNNLTKDKVEPIRKNVVELIETKYCGKLIGQLMPNSTKSA